MYGESIRKRQRSLVFIVGARDIDLLYTCLLQMRRIQQAAKIVTCPEAHMVLPQLSPDQRHRHFTISTLVDDDRSAPREASPHGSGTNGRSSHYSRKGLYLDTEGATQQYLRLHSRLRSYSAKYARWARCFMSLLHDFQCSFVGPLPSALSEVIFHVINHVTRFRVMAGRSDGTSCAGKQ